MDPDGGWHGSPAGTVRFFPGLRESSPAWKAYDEAVAPVRKAYDEAVVPSRKAYNEAKVIAFYTVWHRA